MTLFSALREQKERVIAFFQRGKRGYSDRDAWNVDIYLAKLIPDMLRHLAKTDHGFPPDFEGGHDAWKTYLEELASSFDAYTLRKESEQMYNMRAFVPDLEQMAKLFDYFPYLWS